MLDHVQQQADARSAFLCIVGNVSRVLSGKFCHMLAPCYANVGGAGAVMCKALRVVRINTYANASTAAWLFSRTHRVRY